MYERRWGVIAAGVVALLVVGAIGWAAGRSSAPTGAARAEGGPGGVGAIRVVAGVPLGVDHTRSGALAAADNYVARAAETIVQDPAAFRQLVQRVWQPATQSKAFADGRNARKQAPDAVANYAAGGRGLSITAARRLESYDATRASVLTWGAGFIWGPDKRPTQRWFLARTKLVWVEDQWRVAALDELPTAAPTPYRVIVGRPGADSTSLFDSTLDEMSAPIYGGSGGGN
jgi:hypothetical protein